MKNPVEKSQPEIVATRVFDSSDDASEYVAQQIALLIKEKTKLDQPAVLGLATGNTPLLVYKKLIRMHRDEGLSFKNVITFNLDEYYPMTADNVHSYHVFMYDNLFSHIDIDPSNVHIPKGTLSLQELEVYCVEYDNKIQSVGGLDIQLLGIGRSGHIGFNEPGSMPEDGTRLVALNSITIEDASEEFGGAENVPAKAITMGVRTIFQAKKIYLLAWGNAKADVIRRSVEGPITSDVPASFLQRHTDCLFVLDGMAAAGLSCFDSDRPKKVIV